MLTTSAKYKTDKYKSESQTISGSITLSDGTLVNIMSDDIIQNTLTMQESCVPSSSFTVGGAVANTLSLGIFIDVDNLYLLDNAQIQLWHKYIFDDDTEQEIPYGKYLIDPGTVKRSRKSINFTAYDYLIKFDKNVSGNISGSPYQILKNISASCGVMFGNSESYISALPNGMATLTYTKQADGAAVTYRDILVWVTQLLGCFARINRNSTALEIVQFSQTVDFTLSEENSISRSCSDYAVSVTGVSCGDVTIGDDTYSIDLSSNLLISERTDKYNLLANLYNAIKDLTFYTISAEWFGDLSVQAGDCFEYQQDGLHGGSRKAIVMSQTWKPRSSEKISSYGGTYSQAYNPIAKAVAQVMNAIGSSKTSIQQDIENAIADATAAICGGANGFFYIIQDDDGINKETLWGDNKDPLLATHGIRINKEGIGFWVKTSEEQTIFTGPYTNAWTIDGNLVADFIRAGTLKGIRIECDNGSIAGWEVTADSLTSPDGSVKLESSKASPETTHKWLREQGYTHKSLKNLTHRQIRSLNSKIVGQSRITTTNGEYKMVLESAEAEFYQGDVLRTKINAQGQHFYDEKDGSYLGFAGTNRLINSPETKGIVFDLDIEGDYMSWGAKENGNETYTQIFTYYRKSDSFEFSRAVTFNSNIDAHNKLNVVNGNGKIVATLNTFSDGGAGVIIKDNRYCWALDNGLTEEVEMIFGYNTENHFYFNRLAELRNGLYIPNNAPIDFYSELNMHNWAIVDGFFESTSDERLKGNIGSCEVSGLDVINALEMVQFDWLSDGRHEDIGFKAQQVGKVSSDLMGEHNGICTVNEGRLIRYLVKAVQELSREVEDLKNGNQ